MLYGKGDDPPFETTVTNEKERGGGIIEIVEYTERENMLRCHMKSHEQ